LAIIYNEQDKVFLLLTNQSSYQIKIGPYETLLHLYYGQKVESNVDYLVRTAFRSHSGNPAEAGKDREFSMDTQLQEYSTAGLGDYRISCLEVLHQDGSCAADLRYKTHRIQSGKYRLDKLPSVYEAEDVTMDTLVITCIDQVANVEVDLYYGVVEELDVITRAVKVRNCGTHQIAVHKVLSACLDFPDNHFDLIHFYGKHCMEREYERTPINHAKLSVESTRGMSSHHHNPFVILADRHATETAGECYGFSLLYSGNFLAQVEVDQIGQTRFAMGIHPYAFRYALMPGDEFTSPEIAMSYSCEGLQKLSQNYHKLIRNHICRGIYKNARRPILINNWEATYFDYNADKLVEIASESSKLGIEMLVMDDGWFGKRENDDSSLGDWVVNQEKLGVTLDELTRRVNAAGCKFGIWVEPEMVSEDSDLYRKHPDWCLHIPHRPTTRCRYQLVLDLTREDVRNYIYEAVSALLDSGNVEYVKWDCNRNIAEAWSAAKDADHQGQVYHDYVLGLYEVLERLVTDYPRVLFEGCSGGGGRFDAGMLYYMPQIWCSDNTCGYERLTIQYGTSFGYPISAVGSHVSAVPNHQNGRVTPLYTRGVVAMAGSFGYELDVNKLSDEEKECIKEQVAVYKRNYDLIHTGLYYRLSSPYQDDFTAWQMVSEDKSQSLVSVVFHQSRANANFYTVLLRGLKESALYQVKGEERIYTGAALMQAGLILPTPWNDYQAYQYEMEMITK
jgi:alpha-galactosidase